MKCLNKSFLEEKKSKFYGYLYFINDILEVESIINDLREEHKKCKHIVYACKIDTIVKKYEDKEPVNTAGKPILDLIELKKLDNVLIVVVRYFGGTLLGRGLLTRCYRKCVSELLK